MANSEDLNRLNSGELDLSHCDLSGANLTGRLIPNRDFTKANLQQVQAQAADFRDCNFTAATFQYFDGRDAKFSNSKFAGPIPLANFFAAELRNVNFFGCSFAQVDFSKADIRGADFRNAQFLDGVKFDNVVIDEATLFDGANAMRAMASLPAFDYYNYERGQFVRKKRPPETNDGPATPSELWLAQSTQVLSEIQKAEGALLEVRAATLGGYLYIAGADYSVAGIGHNNPPPDLVLKPEDIEEVSASIDALRPQINRQPDTRLLKLALFSIKRVETIAKWIGEQSKIYIQEVIKGAGAKTGERLVDLASLKVALIVLSGALAALSGLITPILKALGFL